MFYRKIEEPNAAGRTAADKYPPPQHKKEGVASAGVPAAPLTGEDDCQDAMEFGPAQASRAAPRLHAKWLDAPPASSKRRSFSAEEKARIVAESFESGQSVCAVARRYQLTASQLFAWRKRARLQRKWLDGNPELLVAEPALED
jgi:hypothetical protein